MDTAVVVGMGGTVAVGDGSGVDITITVGNGVFVDVVLTVLAGVIIGIDAGVSAVQLTVLLILRAITSNTKNLSADFDVIIIRILFSFRFIAQRLALPAGGRDETTPLCRNRLQAKETA
jgi:hypothetical protein